MLRLSDPTGKEILCQTPLVKKSFVKDPTSKEILCQEHALPDSAGAQDRGGGLAAGEERHPRRN